MNNILPQAILKHCQMPDSLPDTRALLYLGFPPSRARRIVELFQRAGATTTNVQIDGSDGAEVWRTDCNIVALHQDGDETISETLRGWRQAGFKIPVIVLTEGNHVSFWLDAGADDCVPSSIGPDELRSRLNALTRRFGKSGAVTSLHDLRIDSVSKTVERNGQKLELSPREFTLLEFLVAHRGKVVSRRSIREHVFDDRSERHSNLVDVYIRYLRQKIDDDFELKLIVTRRGYGYMILD
jgi:two-component system, OmpR family, copper resistance phosphate regulon response regulator CusR